MEARIFISYAHADRKWLQAKDDQGNDNPKYLLDRWQRTLERKTPPPHKSIFWYDREESNGLIGGDPWQKRILDEIERADVAVLLITQNFVISSFIYSTELPRILERSKAGRLEIVPILLEVADHWDLGLEDIQFTPRSLVPLNKLLESDHDGKAAQLEIDRSLVRAVQRSLEKRGGGWSPQPPPRPMEHLRGNELVPAARSRRRVLAIAGVAAVLVGLVAAGIWLAGHWRPQVTPAPPLAERELPSLASGPVPAAPAASGAAAPPPAKLEMDFTGYVATVAYSPDGKRLATGSDDKTVRVWDLATGREVQRLEGHAGGVGSVVYSPDGKTLASCSSDDTVRVWDLATGQEVRRLEGHSVSGVVPGVGVKSFTWVTDAVFSPDGKRLAAGSMDGTVRVWDVSKGQEMRRMETGHAPAVPVAFSPDGKRLASGSDDRTVRVWELASGQEVQRLVGHAGPVHSLAYSPDGRRLASGGHDGTARLWDMASGREVQRLVVRGAFVNSVAYSLDGRSLATGDSGMTVLIWDATSGREVRRLVGHTVQVNSVVFSPDGTRLASAGGWDKTVRIWDVASGQELQRLEGFVRPK